MKKVTGIGGIFFKCKDPARMRSWYEENLGIVSTEYGAGFEWLDKDSPEKVGYTAWNPFASDTKYFEPSRKDFMVNYRVENLELLVEQLRNNGVVVVDDISVYDYGKFVHILDAEGNAIELWEPA